MNSYKMSGNSLMTDGIFSVVAGIILLFLTGISQSTLVFLFGGYAIILGIAQIVAASGEREPNKNTTYLTVLGAYSIIAGIALMFFWNASLTTVIALMASYVVITGVAEVFAAYDYRQEMGGYMWLIGTGIIRVVFGVILLFATGLDLATLVLWIAIYATVVGLAMTVFGYEVRAQIGKYHQHQVG